MSNPAAIPRDEFFESMLGDFLDESGQLLDRLNENMLQLDEWFRSLDDAEGHSCDVDLLNEMFRSAHSLKGLSAMLGLTDINHLTHKIENVFDAARKDELPVNGEVVELMFHSIDRLVGLVHVLKEPSAENVDCSDVLDGIHRVLDAAGVEKAIVSQADAEKTLNQLAADAQTPVPAEQTPVPAAQTPAPAEQTAIVPAPVAETPISSPAVDHFAEIIDECDLQSKYISIFIDETEMSLDNLTETLLAMEQNGQREAIEQLLMTSHRVKGSAASIGLNHAAKLAHLMEDLMQDISSSGKPLTPRLTDALLACIDGLRTYVDSLKAGNPRYEHFNSLACQLIASQAADEPAKASAEPAWEEQAVPATAEVEPRAEGIDSRLRDCVRTKIGEADCDSVLVGLITFQPHLPLVGLKGLLLHEKLTNLGDLRHFSPAVEQLEEIEDLSVMEFGLISGKSLDEVKKALHIAGVKKVEVETLTTRTNAAEVQAVANQPADSLATRTPSRTSLPDKGPAAKAEPKNDTADEDTKRETPAEQSAQKSGKAAATDSGNKPTETLRVDIERLDQLMNLAGQLVINKARFEQIGDKLKKAVSGRQSRNVVNDISAVLSKMLEPCDSGAQPDMENVRSHARRIQNDLVEIQRDLEALAAVRSSVNDLFETIHLLDRVTDGIQQSVMDTRMLPIGPLFQRFKRVIRDISKANGKNIRLDINGEKTELDKRMIDELADPLIHMVRNSADHGVESPEERRAAGKPDQGIVTLDAFHRGNSIYIRVGDDGKGLDIERIKAKAIDKGLISAADAERISKSQLFQMIWEPGFSTAEKVTEVSGRGMGMDIVKSKIEGLNGTVELDSEPGRGTTITIKLPLTLAILPSLMVSIENDIFAMPLESVSEIVSISPKDVCTVHGRPTARVRGRVVSMVELDAVFSWRQYNHAEGTGNQRAENGPSTLVIINENGRELGLTVDHVIGEQDIVIKSMAENYRNVQGIAGASILGDGRVSLILDLAALIDMATCHKVEA